MAGPVSAMFDYFDLLPPLFQRVYAIFVCAVDVTKTKQNKKRHQFKIYTVSDEKEIYFVPVLPWYYLNYTIHPLIMKLSRKDQ